MKDIPGLNVIREQLQNVLALDLDEFGLDLEDGEWISSFSGFSLRSIFQPIYDDRTKGWIGYEALLRAANPKGDSVTPVVVFEGAKELSDLIKLDRATRTLHLLNYREMSVSRGLLFLNVHAKLIAGITRHGRVFESILHAHSIPTRDVVIEVLESEVKDESKLLEAVANYRERGYRVAIDDFGSQYSNLDRLWNLSPDYVKFDRSVILGAQQQSRVRSTLPKLIEIVRDLGALPILEGVENVEQLQLGLDSGAALFQGYYFQRPEPVSYWKKAGLNAGSGDGSR